LPPFQCGKDAAGQHQKTGSRCNGGKGVVHPEEQIKQVVKGPRQARNGKLRHLDFRMRGVSPVQRREKRHPHRRRQSQKENRANTHAPDHRCQTGHITMPGQGICHCGQIQSADQNHRHFDVPRVKTGKVDQQPNQPPMDMPPRSQVEPREGGEQNPRSVAKNKINRVIIDIKKRRRNTQRAQRKSATTAGFPTTGE